VSIFAKAGGAVQINAAANAVASESARGKAAIVNRDCMV
jgi:hypothetical protein